MSCRRTNQNRAMDRFMCHLEDMAKRERTSSVRYKPVYGNTDGISGYSMSMIVCV
jgi:hypothetical protein